MGLEIFNERNLEKDKKDILTSMGIFYEHALKYRHNPSKQSTNWIETIMRTSKEVNEIISLQKVKNIQNITPEEYLNAYEIGRQKASKKNPQCKDKIDIFNEFPTAFEVADINRVNTFITNEAVHPYVKDYLIINKESTSLVKTVLDQIYGEDY